MSDLVPLLRASIDLKRQEKLIAALSAENALLRARLRVADARRSTFDLSAEIPAFFKQQIGPTS